jgi:hypothetical protein
MKFLLPSIYELSSQFCKKVAYVPYFVTVDLIRALFLLPVRRLPLLSVSFS